MVSTTSTTSSTTPTTISTTTSTSSSGIEPEPSHARVLVFHKTAGFHHDSISAGIQALSELGEAHGFVVTPTDDASIFTETGLADFDVIVFLSTTGDVLDASQQLAMEHFIGAGNGFVGIHAAADTEYDWSWYGGLVGAYFDNHPAPQTAHVDVGDPNHPIMRGLPTQFERFDEWYSFRGLPPPGVTVLATLDEASYEGGTMGAVHPIVWAQQYEGGRSAYIAFGHTDESFSEPLVRTLLTNAILWAAESEIES
ncbi:MAG TPA: ThuA domain-containing protein [Ilumatobacteraceae bacterium]|nr:ThuA domain-containing protein [Ilumatobacteraceae bacterium]